MRISDWSSDVCSSDLVVVDTTAISRVVPETNSLTYRGYPVQELAEHCSFEEVAWLLWNGELTRKKELGAFERSERRRREIGRSEERRVGVQGGRKCRTWRTELHSQKKIKRIH